MYQIVRALNDHEALLYKDQSYFVASFAVVPFSGSEVLVFPATINGKITDSLDVDGGRGYHSLQEFLDQHVG
jgi:inosine/xanthosine triphosphate pyrophosphatase family protein